MSATGRNIDVVRRGASGPADAVRTPSRRRSGHALVTQQRIDARLAPAEGLEVVHRRAAAADLEDRLAVAAARLGVEHAGFFECAPHIRRQYFSPAVAVVAGGSNAPSKMCEKLCAKRLNAATGASATCARTSCATCSSRVGGIVLRGGCAGRTARTPCGAACAARCGSSCAASSLSNNSRGSGSPVSTCALRRCSTCHSQQKFSMNWLGSSTASHSTPEMPDTASSSTCVSRWCRPWPNSWNSVIRSSCDSSAGRSLTVLQHRRREVADQDRHRQLHAVPGRGAASAAARCPSRRRSACPARACRSR